MWMQDPFMTSRSQAPMLGLEDTKDVNKQGGEMMPFQPLNRRQLMQMNLSETDNGYRLTAEMPGVNKDEIKVNVDNNVLTIEGEKKTENKEERETFHRIERSYGKYFRSLRLPENADANQVNAKYVDGVLTVELGKKPVQQVGKQITIQ
eukprot:GILJ01022183.1.p1 GENE.GILJ01022183.1~~GILJ01022183.1.p1  ORF type:complete len:159 (-),score=36.67 GILJ01022183.1:148-594(-)